MKKRLMTGGALKWLAAAAALFLLWYDGISDKRYQAERAHRQTTDESLPAVKKLLKGNGQAIDGDSFKIGELEVRLHGIDAPEFRQTCRDQKGEQWACGVKAGEELQKLLEGRPLTCEVETTDSYGRSIATCFADGKSINRQMVANGWAVAYRRYSKRYAKDEQQAKAAALGIWRGQFVKPHRWRQSS